MRFKKILPSVSLQPFVKYYWLLEVDANEIPCSQLLFPFDSFELIFNLRNMPEVNNKNTDSISKAESLFAGQFTKPFILNYTTACKSAGISLQPWAGNVLFNVPAQEFTNSLRSFKDLDKKSRLSEHLVDAQNETEIWNHFETYLMEKIGVFPIDTVTNVIAQKMLLNPPADEINKFIETIGLGRRRIEQRFIEATGLSMGSFRRKIRFQKAANVLLSFKNHSLTHVGLCTGYYDQPHFIREFKAFSELTPKEFIKKAGEGNTSHQMKDMLIF